MRLFGVVLAGMLLVLGSGVATAQDATPAAGSVDCAVEPRTVGEMVELAATPTAEDGTPADSSIQELDEGSDFQAPEGEAADEETVAAVTETINELFACINAGDYLRAFALYSDRFVQTEFAGISEEDLSFFSGSGTPEAIPAEEQIQLLGVSEVIVLEDGRVGAVIQVSDPTGNYPEGEEDFVTFVEEDGRYKVDSVVVISAEGGTPEATPAS